MEDVSEDDFSLNEFIIEVYPASALSFNNPHTISSKVKKKELKIKWFFFFFI